MIRMEAFMKNILFQGSGVALITPFTKENQVNYPKLQELIEFQIANQTDSIIICGTTGESSTLSEEEYQSVIRFTVETVKKRIPVIAGSGSNCTQKVIEKSKFCEKVGCDGLLIVTPYYNKATQEGLIQHYTSVSQHTNLPIILYNVPSRTGVNLLPKTALELSKLPNIVAIKEASGNISQIAELASLCKEELNIYSGNDDQIVPILSLRRAWSHFCSC